MSQRTLVVLVLLAVVAGGVAWMAGDKPSGPSVPGLGAALLPGLRERVNDVAAIAVQAADGRFTARRGAEGWTIDESDGYPAKFETVKKTLMGLSELRTLEAKTANPARHAELGLEDPEAPGSTSALVTLLDAQGQSLGAVILGRSGSAPQSLYARRASDAQCWLVKGGLYLERSANQWMDRVVHKLPASRVRTVTIEHADGERVQVAKAAESDPEWAVQDLPAGKVPLSSGIGRTCAAALEWLNFDQVAALESRPLPAEGRATATFETFDGLRVTVASARVEPAPPAEGAAEEPAPAATTWITVSVGASAEAGEAIQAEARAAQERLARWTFAVPEYAAGNLRKRLADLIKDEEPAEPPPAEAETPAADGPPADAGAAPAPDDPAAHDHAAEPPAAEPPADPQPAAGDP